MHIPDLKGRSLLRLQDLSDVELGGLLELAAELKARKRAGRRDALLERKSIALVFEKASTRTRCAAVAAMADEGGCAEYLSTVDIHLGKKESVADTARVLGRMFDGILFRGFQQGTVERLAQHAGIPVWNGLTDEAHPTQAMADLLTVREAFGCLRGINVAYVGDGRNNVAVSLMLACAKSGVNFVNCTPAEREPDPAVVREARALARGNGAESRVENDPLKGVQGANAVCTDVWVSMGEESRWDERLALLRPYRVNMKLMEATGNLSNGRVIFLHCLPAFHNRDTDLTRECGAIEVTDDVFEAPFSRVFEEAENRLHTMKALFVATIG